MLPSPRPQSNLSTRVDQRRQQLAEDTSKAIRVALWIKLHGYEERQDLSTSTGKYHTRLQARRIAARRADLADISANPGLRQRESLQNHTIPIPHLTLKEDRTMQDDEGVQRGGKRHRGRPKKAISESSQQSALYKLPDKLPDELAFPLPDRSIRPSEGSPQRRKSQSPRKKNDTSLDQTKTPANITLAYLETCSPSVKLLSHQNVRDLESVRAQMSAAVEDLHNRLQHIPHGLIPSELKVSWNCSFFSKTLTD